MLHTSMMTCEALQRCVAIHHRRPQDTCLPTWKAPDGVIHGWIGDGLSRDIFAAEVVLADGRCDAYVVALPRRDAEPALDERTSRELRLMARLHGRRFPFRVPEMIGAFPDGDRLALVRRFAAGIELDLRAGRQASIRPWAIVGEIAAAIHAVLSGHGAQPPAHELGLLRSLLRRLP